MTEDEARAWMAARWPNSIKAVEHLVILLRDEATRQNLVAHSTLGSVWARHVVDSAQLAELAPDTSAPWLDIGTGGGFPGLVCALLRPEPFVLVEPRRRRADFLTQAAERLGMTSRVRVVADRVERVAETAGTITARAVASIAELLTIARRCISPTTVCIFPRGHIDADDVAAARATWNMLFHVEQSRTDPASAIAVIRQVTQA